MKCDPCGGFGWFYQWWWPDSHVAPVRRKAHCQRCRGMGSVELRLVARPKRARRLVMR